MMKKSAEPHPIISLKSIKHSDILVNDVESPEDLVRAANIHRILTATP